MNEDVFIGLGSNLGDREFFLREALAGLTRIDAVTLLGCSSLYDSAAVGPPQPRYLNAVVRLHCDVTPQRLLGILKRIEADLGRAKGDRWSARPIDLDILLWGVRVVAEPELQIPHLELHKRRFALEPLCELAPGAHHPLLGATVEVLLEGVAPQDVIKLEATLLEC